MSAVIAEPKLEGQTVPFSHTTPMGYNLIKIQTHSTSSPYAVQVVFTVRQPLSASLGTPPLLFVYLHQCPPACLSHRLHVCWHTWARGLRFMSCTRLLICNLCHTSPAFSPAMVAVSMHRPDFHYMVASWKHDNVKQTKPSNIAHFSNNNFDSIFVTAHVGSSQQSVILYWKWPEASRNKSWLASKVLPLAVWDVNNSVPWAIIQYNHLLTLYMICWYQTNAVIIMVKKGNVKQRSSVLMQLQFKVQ